VGKVTMLVSVGAGALDVDESYEAGKEYDLDDEKADEFIVKGYASGTLSRPYDESEKAGLLGQIQAINFGGEIDVLRNQLAQEGGGS